MSLFFIICLAFAAFVYTLGAFIMFITGNGWMALTWPYHLTLLVLDERKRT